jgi:dienelactone hydrolase
MEGKDTEKTITLRVGDEEIYADLTLPAGKPLGLVVFAHGSGSGRQSSRNRFVAEELRKKGSATLLADLLSKHEEDKDSLDGHLRFNIPFLARRLNEISDKAKALDQVRNLPLAFFGASTGGGAAIEAASKRTDVVAVISRGGRPDLASEYALQDITCPTLLIVGELDAEVLKLNRDALRKMKKARTDITTIPKATHLFEEPGKLEMVASIASEYFAKQFREAAAAEHDRDEQSKPQPQSQSGTAQSSASAPSSSSQQQQQQKQKQEEGQKPKQQSEAGEQQATEKQQFASPAAAKEQPRD